VLRARGVLAIRSRMNGPGSTNHANRYPNTWTIGSRLDGQDRASRAGGGGYQLWPNRGGAVRTHGDAAAVGEAY
jgi:hypothetical protein